MDLTPNNKVIKVVNIKAAREIFQYTSKIDKHSYYDSLLSLVRNGQRLE